MNSTLSPWQTGLAEALMETPTLSIGLTVKVIVLEMAGLTEQGRLEVIIHCTWSLLAGVKVNTDAFDPTLFPFNFH